MPVAIATAAVSTRALVLISFIFKFYLVIFFRLVVGEIIATTKRSPPFKKMVPEDALELISQIQEKVGLFGLVAIAEGSTHRTKDRVIVIGCLNAK